MLESELLLEIKQLARASGVTAASIIRDALEQYLERKRTTRKLSFTAIGRSGRRTVSKNAEAILRRHAKRRRSL
jgi:hypothetical protein